MLEDGQVVDAANVVWCTGFRQVFDWIKLPIFDGRGGRWSIAASSRGRRACTSAG
jgi:hypothetical protein